MVAPEPSFSIQPYSYAEARTIERELGLAEPVAAALVRRGYRTPEDAREFLEAGETHEPFEFESMREIVQRIQHNIETGRRITVHGDYDVDGVCATAILIGALRSLGADCDWYVPDRMRDGYGMTAGTVERLASRGTDLIVTVDCGIGSAGAVEVAAARGVDVIVTDHHEPPAELPQCPILHPRLDGYPFGDLCGTGVSLKLATALAGPGYAEISLDLAALATVADMVELVGENRSLVRRGLAVARRAQRPGLRALCAAASVDPVALDEGDMAFRLGPRINAAGRLYRADAAVELMLTTDDARADAIAAELDDANRERRETERRVVEEAEKTRRELPDELRASGLVLAGEGWHPGVVGIAASRMVERHGLPAVLIGLAGQGRGRGSARSVPGFDMLAALEACGEHLIQFGGHRAAAGLEIEAEAVEPFRRAFVEYARSARGDTPEPHTEEIDAIVGGESLGLDVAQQFERLAPFGVGNPGIRLLVPGARLGDVRPMGEGERHARFTLASGSRRALGVAFGVDGSLDRAVEADEPVDVSLRLEVNQWNGAVEPRVVLGHLYASEEANGEEAGEAGQLGEAEWWQRLEAEISMDLGTSAAVEPGSEVREIVDRRGSSGVASVAALASAGEPVLVLACDALRRRALVELAAKPARFGGGQVAILSRRLPQAAVESTLAAFRAAGSGVALADWSLLETLPELAAGFEHVLAIDPPLSAELSGLAAAGYGFLHLAWGQAEVTLSSRVHEAEWPSRAVLAAVYRSLREAAGTGTLDQVEARRGLAGPGPFARSPEAAARCLRVLQELELVRRIDGADPIELLVLAADETKLERSPAYLHYRERCEAGVRMLAAS